MGDDSARPTGEGEPTATRPAIAAVPASKGANGRTAKAMAHHAPVAVIDLGSNSGRVVVLRIAPQGHVEILADGRSPLRLAKDLVVRPKLAEEAIDRVVAALRDFTSLAA